MYLLPPIRTQLNAMLLCISCVWLSIPALSDIAIIIHPDNTNQLSITKIRKIFLTKTKVFPDGTTAIPIQIENADMRKQFNRHVLNRSESSINSYWARMLFSSKAKPPAIYGNVEDIKRKVARSTTSIAYIDVKDVDNRIKVVAVIPTKDS